MMNKRSQIGMLAVVLVCSGLASGQVVDQEKTDDLDQIIAEKLGGVIERARARAIQNGHEGLLRVNYFFKGYRFRSGAFGSGTEFWDIRGAIDVDPTAQREELPELEWIEDEGEPKEVVFDYQVIDYARDLLAGKFSDQLVEVAESQRDRGEAELLRLPRMQVVEEAVGAYGMHLSKHPEDWFAMREMAVALLELGRVQDAQDLIHVTYLKEPELGIFPISSLLYGEYFEDTIKKLVIRAVQHTNRKPSAEGWLMVGVLMQAQGRVERAGEMIDRAEGLGLDSTIVEGLRESLP